ncbi:MAG: hypothetical protein NVS9B15_21480 [Acidobacteriaceae bacterium]
MMSLAGVVFAVVVFPQMRTMLTVHMASGHAQHYGLGVSFVRLVQALGESEAFLPWHPLALLALAVSAALCVSALIARTRFRKNSSKDSVEHQRIAAFAVLGVVYFVVLALAGLGGKPRSGLLLVPLFALISALGLDRLGRRVQMGLLLLFVLWTTVGSAHLLGRYGAMKSGINDRPEEVVGFILRNINKQPYAPSGESGCAAVVVYDSGLAYRLAQSKIANLRIVSAFGGEIFSGSAGTKELCAQPLLFVVESYIDGVPMYVEAYQRELHAAESFIGAPKLERLDPDPDAGRKRSLARLLRTGSGARLPDFRYVVVWGTMTSARYRTLLDALPDFHGVTR